MQHNNITAISGFVVFAFASVDAKTLSNKTESASTFIDSRDGKTYKSVAIGKQHWMAENVNYKSETSSCYMDIESKCSEYGRLYSWEEANSVCPAGWHLPTTKEWQTLKAQAKNNSTGLKSSADWNGTDAFGFNALPGGSYRPNKVKDLFIIPEGVAAFWSSTESSQESAWFYKIETSSNGLEKSESDKRIGFSVRCIQSANVKAKKAKSIDTLNAETDKPKGFLEKLFSNQ